MRSLYLRVLLLLITAASAALLIVTAVSIYPAVQSVSAEFQLETSAELGDDYILRAVDGEICIYQGNELIRRTGYSVSMLPKEDRMLLEAGIAANTQQALTSLLEDLCS